VGEYDSRVMTGVRFSKTRVVSCVSLREGRGGGGMEWAGHVLEC